ncbi:MAG: hypothetical protein H6737_28140 [Alphaproteobacteria bacterium]|nr:hypothetical protein [Alphaproteobacteria bacterium]
MHASQLPIPKPCEVPWESMEGDDRRRLCAQCDKHVHDLSALTEREARRVAKPGVCVQYRRDAAGNVRFRPSRRARLVAFAGALLAGPALADEPATTEPAATEPSFLDRVWTFLTGDGEATRPDPGTIEVTVTTPTQTALAATDEPMVRGEIAFHPAAPPPTTPATTNPSTAPRGAR